MKTYWKRNKLFLAVTLLFGSVSAVFTAFVSVVLQKIIDAAVGGDVSAFTKTMIFTVFYVAALCLLSYLSSLSAKYLLLRISKQMREEIFEGIMRHTPTHFRRVGTADYISALTNDMKSVEENYILTFLMTIELAVMFLATLVILFLLSPLITLILLLNMFLMFAIPAVLGKILEKRQAEISRQLAAFTEKIKDIFSGFDVIRGYRMMPQIRKQFQEENEKTAKKRFAADRMFALNEGLSDTLSTLSIIIVIFVSAYLVMKGSITMGTLLALTQLSGSFMTPVILLMQSIPKLKSMKPVLKRLQDFADYQAEEWQGDLIPSFERNVAFKNVTFSYDGSGVTLDGVNLTLDKGKKYVLLGQSGCGKTTLVKLLSGYSSRYTGQILYDGKELRELDMARLAGLVSVIDQNVYLFHTSVKHNITLFQDFSAEQLAQAVSESGVSYFLDQLEQGMDTDVGENGSQLSGGQRQRIALARGFLRNADFIVLDEGTSAVDRKTAREIESRLLNRKDLTLITITHALSQELLEQYDEILYMKGGRIEARGTFQEVSQSEPFRSFLG